VVGWGSKWLTQGQRMEVGVREVHKGRGRVWVVKCYSIDWKVVIVVGARRVGIVRGVSIVKAASLVRVASLVRAVGKARAASIVKEVGKVRAVGIGSLPSQSRSQKISWPILTSNTSRSIWTNLILTPSMRRASSNQPNTKIKNLLRSRNPRNLLPLSTHYHQH